MSLPRAVRLPLRLKLGNGFGSIAYGVKDNGFSTLLLIFYNQVVGLDAGLIGLILLCALLVDAMVDPLVGHFSDKTNSRWGQRHPWMYSAILPMALFWTLLWYPPETSQQLLYAYLFICAFMMRAAVSCYEVPALAVVPALSADYDERTSITRWRFLFAWGGGLLMLILAFGVFLVPTPGYPVGLLNLEGYHGYALTGAGLIIAATIVSSLSTHRRLAHHMATPPVHLPLRDTLRETRATLSNRAYLILLASTFATYAINGMAFSGATYMLGYVWNIATKGLLTYSLTLFGGVVGAFLLVGAIQTRIEKRSGAFVLGCLGIILSLLPYVLRLLGLFPANDSPILIPLLYTILTLGNSCGVGALMLGQSMMAEVVEASQVKTGKRSEGIFYAGYFFTQKCATGLGLFLMGSVISLSGFPDAAKPGNVAQPVLDTMVGYYLALMLVLGLISTFTIRLYPIRRSDHIERLRQLGVIATGDHHSGLEKPAKS